MGRWHHCLGCGKVLGRQVNDGSKSGNAVLEHMVKQLRIDRILHSTSIGEWACMLALHLLSLMSAVAIALPLCARGSLRSKIAAFSNFLCKLCALARR